MFEILGINKISGRMETVAYANSIQEAHLIIAQENAFYYGIRFYRRSR